MAKYKSINSFNITIRDNDGNIHISKIGIGKVFDCYFNSKKAKLIRNNEVFIIPIDEFKDNFKEA